VKVKFPHASLQTIPSDLFRTFDLFLQRKSKT